MKLFCLLATLALATSTGVDAADDIIIADFESPTYGHWTAEGEAFGSGPANGPLPGQMQVSGFRGHGLVNSFTGGDRTTGTLNSPEFKVQRPWINFLIGGGGHVGQTCLNLVIDGRVVRTQTGSNTESGGSEELQPFSWDVREFIGRSVVLQIVDRHQGGWGHINVDHIVQSDTRAAPELVTLEKTLTVDDTHLIVPVGNDGRKSVRVLLGIYDGQTLVQNFTVALAIDEHAQWLAAYPLKPFTLNGREIRVAAVDDKPVPESIRAAFDRIKIGNEADVLAADDYQHPYRNQFHVSTRRGWNNDPNGMVYFEGKYHLYYQHNPFGISWGNMHWGHFESTDLIHWKEKPVTLFQRTVKDMMFSGGGFVDFNNSAGLGENTQFIAFTSTGRGECLAYSKDGGATFTELKENPVVEHNGRDPKIIWYEPEQKWVMAVFNNEACAETDATPPAADSPENRSHCNIAFWESKNLRQWTRTGAFTDPDRSAVYECPEMFELPIIGESGQSRWILLAAQNRYFIGHFDGQTFHRESGPHGTDHGIFYAAQTFSDVPDGRRIQMGWVRTGTYQQTFPDQIVSQSFTLPHQMTLRETTDGLRVFFWPVKETEILRSEILGQGKDLTVTAANELLQKCRDELSEVVIEFADDGPQQLMINGNDASFDAASARIFTDRTFNEIYASRGLSYEVRKRSPQAFESTETGLKAPADSQVRSLTIYRLKSIWP